MNTNGVRLLLVIGLSVLTPGRGDNERVALVANHATVFRAQPNNEVVRLNRAVTAGSMTLVEEDAKAL